LLKRGDWRQRGPQVEPGFLSAIDNRTIADEPNRSSPATTGRRSALARWLTRPDHPLTARVMANRLWQEHFGRGIVATPSDFGSQGEAATHPELLDWLGCELVTRGWSLKALHRLMVTSATYQQASTGPPLNVQADPENRLFDRMNRRRLPGEVLRDALLAVSARLNLRTGGPSAYPEVPPELAAARAHWPVSADPRERNRRSVYVAVRRNLRYPLFSLFDAPDRIETCARRHATTTAPQALTLLNGKLIREQALEVAALVIQEAGSRPERIVDRAYQRALGRLPDAKERALLLAFIGDELEVPPARNTDRPPSADEPVLQTAVAELCHALVNLNEFIYVD
jgi:hypothetical protein